MSSPSVPSSWSASNVKRYASAIPGKESTSCPSRSKRIAGVTKRRKSNCPVLGQVLLNGRTDVVEVGFGHAGVHPEPEGVVHQAIRVDQVADLAESGSGDPHLIEAGLAYQIAGEQHPGLDPGAFECRNDAVPRHRGPRLDDGQKSEPAGDGVGGRFRQSEHV